MIEKQKILIISGYNLTTNSATDITLRSYFKHWDKQNLLIVTTDFSEIEFAPTLYLPPLSIYKFRDKIEKMLLVNKKGEKVKNVVPSSISNNKENKLKNILYLLGASYLDVLSFNSPENIKTKIKEFKPDYIYTLMGNIQITRLAYLISNKYNIPILPHFMDDWISTQYKGNFLLKFPRYILIKNLKKIFKNTKFGFCISEKMCKEYSLKYNKEFLPLMNSVNIKDYNNFSRKKSSKEISILYIGGLHLNRWKTILAISNELENISKIVDKKIQLLVYSDFEDFSDLKRNKNFLVLNQKVNHNNIPLIIDNADYLLHIESFDKEVQSYIRLSISTKISEYLASGKPIIAVGPNNIASIEYLSENNCAYIISELTKKNITDTIMSAIHNEKYSTMLENALKLAYKNHAADQILKITNEKLQN